MRAVVWGLVVLVLSFACWAQGGERGPRGGPPRRWAVGAGAVYSSEPYDGFDYELIPIPYLVYFGERLTVAGPRASYALRDDRDLSVRLLAMYDFSGYEEDDSDAFEGMDDRDGTVEAGIGLGVALPAEFELEIRVVSDVLGRHDGQEAEVELERGFRNGKWMFAPGVGLAWQSSHKTDFYYGVRESEATPLRPAYEADDALNPEVTLRVSYHHSDRLSFFAMPGIEWLDSEITDSPIVEEHWLFSGILAIAFAL